MKHSTIKKILGKKGTKLAKSVRDYARPKILIINLHDNPLKVDSTKNLGFWKQYQSGDWEPKTLRAFDEFLDKDHSYIDLGAWIGPTVLYASNLSKHCYAFEPDPLAYSELKRNISLNENLGSKITLYDICISDHVGTTNLYYSDSHPLGNAYSSIIERREKYIIVNTTTMKDFIHENHIDDCNFIKVDIEGGEFVILPTMTEYLKEQKPTLLIEIHPDSVKNPKEKLENIRQIFELYKNIYNDDLRQISIEKAFDYAIKYGGRVILSEKTI